MNYKLAKKLKDAGFIQDGQGYYYKPYGGVKILRIDDPDYNLYAYLPTLSELIEMCGDENYLILEKQTPDYWEAKVNSRELGLIVVRGGETPEEAVANLWLKLNE